MAAVAVGARDLKARLAVVHQRILAAGGDPAGVTIVAATKDRDAGSVTEAVEAGLFDIGENYAQELLAKAAGSPAAVRWHFLGAVQSNKVARLAPRVALWQSVDREAAGRAIAHHAPGAAVLVQVNVSGGPERNGCEWDEAPSLVDSLRDHGLEVHGLMAVASPDPEEARGQFTRLVATADRLELAVRCIGMSDDLEIAIAAGASMVRLGRALFGPRPEVGAVRR